MNAGNKFTECKVKILHWHAIHLRARRTLAYNDGHFIKFMLLADISTILAFDEFSTKLLFWHLLFFHFAILLWIATGLLWWWRLFRHIMKCFFIKNLPRIQFSFCFYFAGCIFKAEWFIYFFLCFVLFWRVHDVLHRMLIWKNLQFARAREPTTLSTG